MPDEQRMSGWLTRWREKGELKRRQRPWSHSSLDDSEEKLAQRHTSGGEKLAADDRRLHIKGGGGGFGG